jgi:hypothetical protein
MNLAESSLGRSTPKPLQVAAAVIGNALEWYDFIIFGFLTVVISRLFFPTDSEYASLLLTTATFGVGFFMRPVGGILLGIYADQRGRKAAMLVIIILMTAAMAMIGFAPTYAAIGIAAPLIIVLARLLQGFATGGEFASATSFLIESARPIGVACTLLAKWLARRLTLSALVRSASDTRSYGGIARQLGMACPRSDRPLDRASRAHIRRHLEETEAFLDARARATVLKISELHWPGISAKYCLHRSSRPLPFQCTSSCLHADVCRESIALATGTSLRSTRRRTCLHDRTDGFVGSAVDRVGPSPS